MADPKQLDETQQDRVWRVVCWLDNDRCAFNFTSRAEYDAFMAAKPKEVKVTEIEVAFQHTAKIALSALRFNVLAEKDRRDDR